MITECNADLPLFAYVDWLQEQGWEAREEDFDLVIQGDYNFSAQWKAGQPWNEGDGMENTPLLWYGYDDSDGIKYDIITDDHFSYYYYVDNI
jgi:hypothetical protein